MFSGLAASSIGPAAAERPQEFHDPFPFTGPDFEHGLVIFVNTTRSRFCTPDQIAFEQAVADWIAGGFEGAPPEGEPDPDRAISTIDGFLKQTPMGEMRTTRGWQPGLVMELWYLDDPEGQVGVGACLDTDDRNELFGSGTTSFRGFVNDFFYAAAEDPGIARPWALDSTAGAGQVSTPDGASYSYTWSFHQHIPCEGAPAPVCEVFRSQLRPVG